MRARGSQQLLALPASHLLEQFEQGRGTPGSGSAAALLGSLASSICIGSAKLTRARAKLGEERRRTECSLLIEMQERKHSPNLSRFVNIDTELFDGVLDARRKRDGAKNKRMKQRYAKLALRRLRGCTELLLETAEECIAVAKVGMHLFDIGFRAARGEPATAVCAALAGAKSAILVALLNLTSFRRGAWSTGTKNRCLTLWYEIGELHEKLLRCVMGIREEAELALGAPRQIDLLNLLGPAPKAVQPKARKELAAGRPKRARSVA